MSDRAKICCSLIIPFFFFCVLRKLGMYQISGCSQSSSEKKVAQCKAFTQDLCLVWKTQDSGSFCWIQPCCCLGERTDRASEHSSTWTWSSGISVVLWRCNSKQRRFFEPPWRTNYFHIWHSPKSAFCFPFHLWIVNFDPAPVSTDAKGRIPLTSEGSDENLNIYVLGFCLCTRHSAHACSQHRTCISSVWNTEMQDFILLMYLLWHGPHCRNKNLNRLEMLICRFWLQ